MTAMAALRGVSRRELEAMANAGAEALECERVLARTNDNVVGEILRDQGQFTEWGHYPKGDVYDPDNRSQYYYHAHVAAERVKDEHGHFHIFLRPMGLAQQFTPTPLPDYTPPKDITESLCHLIGVSMDPRGRAFRLFTTNRWVTAEVWHGADDVTRMLDLFRIDHARPSWPTNRWISAVVRLFKPQIVDLVCDRDRIVAEWRDQYPDANIFEDRRLNVVNELWITVPEQMAAISRALDGDGAIANLVHSTVTQA